MSTSADDTERLALEEAVRALGLHPGFSKDPSYVGAGGVEQDPGELVAFTQRLRQKASRESYLELGIGHGGLLRFLTEQVPFPRAVGVDLFFCGWSNEENARRNAQACGAVLVQGDLRSPDMPERIRQAGEGKPFDVVFVDGEHIEASVFADACLAAQVVADDGWICFHDYAHPTTQKEVPPAVQRFLATPAGERFTLREVIGHTYGIAILAANLRKNYP